MPQPFLPWNLMKAALGRGPRGISGAAEPDPLDHPAFRELSLRELADLPWPRPEAGPAARDTLAPAKAASPERHDCPSAA